MDIAFIAQSLWIALMEFVVMMISKANYLFKLPFKIFLQFIIKILNNQMFLYSRLKGRIKPLYSTQKRTNGLMDHH